MQTRQIMKRNITCFAILEIQNCAQLYTIFSYIYAAFCKLF